MNVQERIGIPMDEFIRLYDEAPFELIDGEKRLIVGTVVKHGLVIKHLYALLLAYEQTHHTIEVYSELPFVLVYTPDWVAGSRTPNIMVYRADRMAAYRAQTPDYADKPFVIVPDLCIEVISTNDNYQDVDTKVESYLADGVGAVWVFNPRNKTVRLHTSGSDQITRLTETSTLDGGALLPGFSAAVKAIFED